MFLWLLIYRSLTKFMIKLIFWKTLLNRYGGSSKHMFFDMTILLRIFSLSSVDPMFLGAHGCNETRNWTLPYVSVCDYVMISTVAQIAASLHPFTVGKNTRWSKWFFLFMFLRRLALFFTDSHIHLDIHVCMEKLGSSSSSLCRNSGVEGQHTCHRWNPRWSKHLHS
jgi:hypothetical protein